MRAAGQMVVPVRICEQMAEPEGFEPSIRLYNRMPV